MMMIYLRLGGARWPLITVRVLGVGLGLGEAALDTEVIIELGSGSGERLVSSCNMVLEVTTLLLLNVILVSVNIVISGGSKAAAMENIGPVLCLAQIAACAGRGIEFK